MQPSTSLLRDHTMLLTRTTLSHCSETSYARSEPARGEQAFETKRIGITALRQSHSQQTHHAGRPSLRGASQVDVSGEGRQQVSMGGDEIVDEGPDLIEIEFGGGVRIHHGRM